jgi:YVTN family beta-propeller protein
MKFAHWFARGALACAATHAGTALAQPFAYVGLNYEARVGIIDLATNTTVGYLPAYANTFGLVFQPGTNNLYTCGGGHLTKYDLSTRTEIDDVSYGTSIGDMVVHPGGGFVYLGFGSDQCVRAIETTTNTVAHTAPMPNNTVYVAISHDGSTVYAASANFGGGARTVSYMDTTTYQVTSPITLDGMAGSLAVSPDDTRLFVGYEFDTAFNPGSIVAVYDIESGGLVTPIAVPAGGVTDIVFNPDHTRAYIAQPYINAVTVINLKTLSVETSWSIPGLPWSAEVSPDGQTVYVAAFTNDVVYAVNASTGAVTGTIPVGLGNGGPVRVRIAPAVEAPCIADFNHNNAVDSQDFFDFLSAFFASDPSADVNADHVVNSQDFFDFLTAFFQGCK